MQPAAAARLARQRWVITVVQPPWHQHAEALHEVAEALLFAFRELGYEPILTASLNLPGYRHLIIGWDQQRSIWPVVTSFRATAGAMLQPGAATV